MTNTPLTKKNEGLKYQRVSKIQVNKLIRILGPSLDVATPDFTSLMRSTPFGAGDETASQPQTATQRPGLSTREMTNNLAPILWRSRLSTATAQVRLNPFATKQNSIEELSEGAMPPYSHCKEELEARARSRQRWLSFKADRGRILDKYIFIKKKQMIIKYQVLYMTLLKIMKEYRALFSLKIYLKKQKTAIFHLCIGFVKTNVRMKMRKGGPDRSISVMLHKRLRNSITMVVP